jgi:hypothetical protein
VRHGVWLLAGALGLHFVAVWLMRAADMNWEAKNAMNWGTGSLLLQVMAIGVGAVAVWRSAGGLQFVGTVAIRAVAALVSAALSLLMGTFACALPGGGTWLYSGSTWDIGVCVGFGAGLPVALLGVVVGVGLHRPRGLRWYLFAMPVVMLLAYVLWTAGIWWTLPMFAMWPPVWPEVEAVEKWLPENSYDVSHCAPRILLTFVLATVCVAVLFFATRRRAFQRLRITSSAG